MSTHTQPDSSRLTWLGIAMIILGVISVGAPVVAGSAVVIVIGAVLLIAGISQIIQGLRAVSWSDKLMPFVLGIITTMAGLA